jgi:hypothetical protein
VIPPPDSIAAIPGGLWVGTADTDAVEVSAQSGRVVRNFSAFPSFQKNGPHLMYASGNRLWLAGSIPALYEINTNSGDVIKTSKAQGTFFGSGGFYGIAADTKNIWVTNSSLGQVAEFRRSDDALVRAYS